MVSMEADPVVDLERTRRILGELGMKAAASELNELLTESAREDLPAPRLLVRVLETEWKARRQRRLEMGLKMAGLPPGRTLGNFDFGFQPSLDRTRVELLGTCGWIRERQNVLLQGPPGVGKTHLAVGLGLRALENGFTVSFFRLDELLRTLKRHAGSTTPRGNRRYRKASLLIIDEMGYEALDAGQASQLFRLINDRHERGSVLITTNKAIREWPEVLAGDAVLASAILDRFLHRCVVLDIRGRSYRLRDLERTFRERQETIARSFLLPEEPAQAPAIAPAEAGGRR